MPTVTICSTEFELLGRAEAQALGIEALPLAMIQHPLGGLRPDAVEKRAHSVVDAIQELMVMPREQILAAAYREA
ncbi:MAG: hypothetical protein ETSY1_26180 [Candidatus Entotheonella factor]|uniref:UGSC-like domain-containing protein n=1 Tax=Entotheonella factor TaxID=1429438 RepID=W4LEL8_ENTF1|nr:hypothetical protein [Candidatus Entotheonella palauensis]ETW96548.1 MAG: hypothetical protein ETSY1_26180 [Candidatus Entotheonella factor]